MEEQWRDIEGYVGAYQVSNKGRVRALPRYVFRQGRNGELHTIHRKGCIVSPKKRGLYLSVMLSSPSGRHNKLIHRLVAEAFLEGEGQVNHKDYDKYNNNVDNLEWCDSSYNQRHRYSKEFSLTNESGERHTFTNRVVAADTLGMDVSSLWRLTSGKAEKVKGWTHDMLPNRC